MPRRGSGEVRKLVPEMSGELRRESSHDLRGTRSEHVAKCGEEDGGGSWENALSLGGGNVVKRSQAIPIAVALLLFLSSCAPQPSYRRVRLNAVGEVSSSPHPPKLALRVAVANVLSPQSSVKLYGELLVYLERKLNRPVVLLQRSTYAEINDLIRFGGADVAIVCSGAYVLGHRDFGMELLVAPQVNGRTEYFSYLIVPRDSPAKSLLDLRGKIFAFSDPLSNSGHFAPAYQLLRLGERPETFFRKTIFTYSHDRSIKAVAEKFVDGAAVDSLVYDALKGNEPEVIARTKVVAIWGPYGIPPLVVNPGLQIKEQLRRVLLTMDRDSEGQEVLRVLGIDRFVRIEDAAYASVRRMVEALGL
jgi:phosphonate transport system substrate-binding protein